ncbi:MAG: anti-sigma factor [Acidobacteria bacterium]|nr:anti-sigma factor [Acidobacteriota bacterium]
MNCADCELLLGDAVDGALDPAAQRDLETHLAACDRCRRTAADLRAIRSAASALDPYEPPPHVWTKIAAAIDADGRRPWWRPGWAARGAWASRMPVPRLASVAAAVVLIAGAGWMAWSSRPTAAPPDDPAPAVAASGSGDVDLAAELKAAEGEYVTAITGLEAIAKTSGTELDAETADVLQASLTVIDQAIDESRAALETEPASEVAQESLFEALRSKVVLLQETVALLNEMRKGDQEGAARIMSEMSNQ